MGLYHVRISVEGQKHDEVKLDLNAATLEETILTPYRRATPITINGKSIPIESVARIRVGESDVPGDQLIAQVRAAEANSSVVMLGGPTDSWRAAARARDVTDQFITGPPGSAVYAAQETGSTDNTPSHDRGEASDPEPDTRSVFVVVGRDGAVVSAVFAFLRSLGLRVVEWETAVAKTGIPSPYVGDVVMAGLKMAKAAVVLFTPDDLVRLREDLVREGDGSEETEVRGQARPNVYYEAGIADAIGRDRTVLVEVGGVKSFSDALGRHTVRYDGSPAKRNTFAERLRIAGLDVDTTGEDWLSIGSLELGIEGRPAQELTAPARPVARPLADVLATIDEVLMFHSAIVARSAYDDLSDLPVESLEFVLRGQTLLDEVSSGSSFSLEVHRHRDDEVHERIPVVVAALSALRADLAARSG